MATYAIGDIHGCYETLQALLAEIAFDATSDRLWLVGDLINRGPLSLDVLRWARDLGDRATMVLGNHDLHLIGRVLGARKPKKFDRFDDVLNAPDRDDLIEWLRHRPVLHHGEHHWMVHAGLHPQWSFARSQELAREVETELRSDGCGTLLRDYYDHADTTLRQALRAFVHVRTCRENGEECKFTGPPEEAPEGCLPWYERFPASEWRDTVVFGHWAALGYRHTDRVLALDSGCGWGNALTAVQLDSHAVTQVPLQDRIEGLDS